jgi:hypothetical protein
MPGGQLRYFSLCQNESQSQRFIACATDDQTSVGRDGFMNYVVSTPSERPANARPKCGVTWIPWGPQAGGVLIYRHMLPNPSFAHAIQRVPEQGKEKQVMGDYLPVSRYYAGRAAFEKLGCKQLRGSNPVAHAVCRDRTAPRSSISDEDQELAESGRFSGRSIDRGCRGGPHAASRAGRVAAVFVSVERGGRRVAYGRARLGRPDARGKVPWTVDLKQLGEGSYVATVFARDAAGNLERPSRPSNRFAFTVR